jgi:hypothetical protein
MADLSFKHFLLPWQGLLVARARRASLNMDLVQKQVKWLNTPFLITSTFL